MTHGSFDPGFAMILAEIPPGEDPDAFPADQGGGLLAWIAFALSLGAGAAMCFVMLVP